MQLVYLCIVTAIFNRGTGLSFRYFGLFFYLVSGFLLFLSKECAKCIVMIVNIVLILCLTFAKHNRDISSEKGDLLQIYICAASTRTQSCPAELVASPLQMDSLSLTHCVCTFYMVQLCSFPIIYFAFFVKSPPVMFFFFFSDTSSANICNKNGTYIKTDESNEQVREMKMQ